MKGAAHLQVDEVLSLHCFFSEIKQCSKTDMVKSGYQNMSNFCMTAFYDGLN